MTTLLPTTDSSENDTLLRWQRFVEQRDNQIATMAMQICNNCDGCGGRCTAGILVSQEEYESIQTYLATLPESEVRRVLTQEKSVPWPGAEDSGAMVQLCRYRDSDNNNCFIYPARPTVCRLMGHTHWLPCPIEAVPFYPEGSPTVWNDYRRFERKTWEEWEGEGARG